MELLTGKRFLALRSLVVIGGGLVFGLLVPHPFWIGLLVAAATMVPVILVSPRFLYLTLLCLAVSYGTLSLPAPAPHEIYMRSLVLEARLVEKSGSYSVLMIEKPAQLGGKKVLLYMTREEEQGTVLKLEGQIEPLFFPVNPGTRNRSKQLEREGVIGRFSGSYTILSPPLGIRAWLNQTRKALIEINKKIFSNQASLYTAILLGEREEVSEQILIDMRRTGTLHLLAVSGLHVGVLVGFLFLFLRIFKTPRWLILPLLALMLVMYVALVGPRASILRASVMSIAVAGGFLFERKMLPLNSLALAALIILLFRPPDILSLGFQLSFSAAFGIILAASFSRELLEHEKLKGKIPSWLVKWILLPAALSLFATLFTMPFLAASFHRITFSTILANLPVIPLVSVILPLGLVAILLSLVWLPLGQIVGWVVFGLLWIVEKLLHLLPGSLIVSAAWPLGIVFALYLAALILHTEKARPQRWFYAFGILLVGANLAVWLWAFESTRPHLTVLDTYYGNVALLESDGRTVLLNPGSRAESVVADYLESRGISKIDWILLLSDKEGDLSGLDSLKTRFKVGEIGSVLDKEATTPLPKAGCLKLASSSVEFDMASRSKPFYVVKTDRKKVVFVSESRRIDTTADYNYLLSNRLRSKEKGQIISKNPVPGVQTRVIRESGGIVIGL